MLIQISAPRSIARVGFFVALLCAVVTRSASADVIEVLPGIGTLQAAINAANPGDQLRLSDGVYTGAVVVNKSLKIYCYGNTFGCVIDAECAAPIAVDIAAEGVTLAYKEGNVSSPRIVGGTDTELRVSGSSKVKLYGLQLEQSGFETPCGTENHSLQIANSDKVKGDHLTGLYGFYIHDVPAGNRVSLKQCSPVFSDGSVPSLLIENCGAGADLGKGGIKVSTIAVQANTNGVPPAEVAVQLINSDGVSLKKNTISTNGMGGIGVVLDAQSDNNYLLKNRWADGTFGNTPYVDNGTGNCAKKNFSDPGSTPFPNTCP